jgi:hypothetical protein
LSCGHSHADALAFELAARGRALLLDPGTYVYTGSAAERDRFRSTAAHNTLVLDGASSSEPAGPFSWRTVARARARRWVSRDRFDYFEGEHDGYERLPAPATHRRAALFLKGDYFVVRDRLAGAGAHTCELRFQFAPGCAPEVEGGKRVRERSREDESGLDIFAFGGGGAWRAEGGWVSRCHGAREAAPALVYEARATAGAEFFTLLVPVAAGASGPGVSAREVEARGGRAFALLRDDGSDLLLAGEGGRIIEAGGLASDFELAWARFARGGELAEAVLVGGATFAHEGGTVVGLKERAAAVYLRRDGDEFLVEADGRLERVPAGDAPIAAHAGAAERQGRPAADHLPVRG